MVYTTEVEEAAEVSRAYLQHVYSVLGGSTKILTDNGTEFKNEVFKEMLQKLGTRKIDPFTPIQTTILTEELKDFIDTSRPAWLSICVQD